MAEKNAAGNSLLLTCECGYKLYDGGIGDLVVAYACRCKCGKLLGYTKVGTSFNQLHQPDISEWVGEAPADPRPKYVYLVRYEVGVVGRGSFERSVYIDDLNCHTRQGLEELKDRRIKEQVEANPDYRYDDHFLLVKNVIRLGRV